MILKIQNLWKGLNNSERPLKYFISRLFVHFPIFFKNFYFTRKNYKLSMSSSSLTVTMFEKGEKHLDFEENLFKSIIRQNDSFIDIGANIGHISISLKTHMPSIQCFAIEANPKIFKILGDNIRLNKLDIRSINCAVGEENNTTIKFQDSNSDDANSVISDKMLGKNNENLYIVDHKKELTVKSRTLDSLMDDFSISNNIRLIKVDTEGYEFFVLKGAKNTLKKTEMIFFEYWDRLTLKYDYTQHEIFLFLRSLDFEIYEISENLVIKDFDIKSLKLVTHETLFKKNQNLLAINKKLL